MKPIDPKVILHAQEAVILAKKRGGLWTGSEVRYLEPLLLEIKRLQEENARLQRRPSEHPIK